MSKEQPEDSIRLRFLTSAMSLVGILAASYLAESPVWITLFGIGGVIFGSWLSYKRRRKNNTLIKIGISIGILVVAAAFFRELLVRINLNIADARLPLTNMLITLQALHCFDLPRRRDLSLSCLVGLTLISSAATLSRDMSFALYLAGFIALSFFTFAGDCVSRTKSRAHSSISGRQQRSATLAWSVPLFLLGCLTVFMLLPKIEIEALRNTRLAAGLNLAFLGRENLFSQALTRIVSPDGSIKSNPKAYYGFAEELDTNYRTKLSDQIVLHVSSPSPDYWRGMAFDTFNGTVWTMSDSKTVFSRYAEKGQAIPITPVPTMLYNRNLPRKSLTQVFYLEEDASNLVVCAAVPSLVYFPSNKVEVDLYGSIRSPIGMQKDMVYTVISSRPLFDILELRKQPEPESQRNQRVKRRYANYLQIPPSIDPRLKSFAAGIAGKGNYFVRAERLKNFLQSNYKYSLDVPPAPNGRDTVSDLLFYQKRGYCETFASALVIMCRSQEIPARLATGYAPGLYNPFTGLWEVRLHDAHCWAEVFIPACGWVPLDPTPVAVPLGLDSDQQNLVLAYLENLLNKLSKQLDLAFLIHWLKLLYVPGLVIFAGFLLWFLRKQGSAFYTWIRQYLTKNSRQRAKAGLPESKASLAFQRVVESLSSFNIKRSPSDTSLELLRKVELRLHSDKDGESFGSAGDCLLSELGVFLDHYSEARFGKKQGTDELNRSADQLAAKLKSLAKARSGF
ncbi:MAG: transglutaminaseTgpA domain-containing protein [Candidatus Obscuribacterales bacterium]|nr:transglutaminaseTgpA domain-containing protein [Candidatus Obscuribacterales bacterium]